VTCGLRDYKLPPLIWPSRHGDREGTETCEHEWGEQTITDHRGTQVGKATTVDAREATRGSWCHRCGAWRGSLGLEPTPGLYVQHLVGIFERVKRVLRDDGLLFVNLGDAYVGAQGQGVPLYDTWGTVPEDCPLHDSPWNRPYDGCEAAPILRTFDSDHVHGIVFRVESVAPNQGRMAKRHGHPANGDSVHGRRTQQSEDATEGQQQSEVPFDEPLHVSPVSMLGVSSRQLQDECLPKANHAFSRAEPGTSCDDCQACGDRKVSRGVLQQDVCAMPDQQRHNNGNVVTADASVSRTADMAYGSCPYRHSTTTSHRGQLSPKNLLGMPWRVAFAMQDAGWILRSAIVWAKGLSFCQTYSGSVMPESVRDRPTRGYEMVFMFAKQQRYFYDWFAARESGVYPAGSDAGGRVFGGRIKGAALRAEGIRVAGREYEGPTGTRNWRNVWVIGPKPFSEAHFATYPPELAEKCIIAGTSPYVCAYPASPEAAQGERCGAPWERIVNTDYAKNRPSAGNDLRASNGDRAAEARGHGGWQGNNLLAVNEQFGWQTTCGHPCRAPGRAVVLDPFGGSGTTGLAAKSLGRDAILIELSEDYCRMAEKRVGAEMTAPLFG